MYAPRVSSTLPQTTKHAATQLLRAAQTSTPSCKRTITIFTSNIPQQHHTSPRPFSSTALINLREAFPKPDAPNIKKTEAKGWRHPIFTESQMKNNIAVAHRETRDWRDKIALGMVRLLRWGTDFATGYKHDVEEPKRAGDANAVVGTKPYAMSERKWLIRFIFLESVAGVPGMVAGMLRHLHSIRRLRRDNGWIETLLEEAYNERMHLLTFLKLAEPGWFMRIMCIGAQGVFFNSFFIAYLISPQICHRFVGYLEEEAVLTYTLAIRDLEEGKLPLWLEREGKGGEVRREMGAPDIAVGYWNMPEGKRSVRDLLYYIRADEAKHREVNHTLGNLKQDEDPNPFVSEYFDESRKERPEKGIGSIKGTGWEREEVL